MPPVLSLERGVAVEHAAFAAMDLVLRRRAVRLLLEKLEAGRKDVTALQLSAAAELEKGKSLMLPGGILISVEDGLFRVERRGGRPEAAVLPREGEARWGTWRFVCSVVNDRREENENTLVFSLDKIKRPVSVSFWDQKGRLDAGRGSRSLKRLFTDAAFSVREREETPVLYCGGAPIAIVGVAAERSLAEGGGPWWVVAARDEKE